MAKQLKISELKRVVNVDMISKYANALKDTNFKDERQINAILDELNKKTPSREVLMKTRLGFILKDLGNRSELSAKVRGKALDLRRKWKEFHKRLLLAPKFDVKCDKPTTENRTKARAQLSDAFLRSNQSPLSSPNTSSVVFCSDSDDHESLVNDLEFAVYNYCDTLVNAKYFKFISLCGRQVVNNATLRNQYLTYQLEPLDLLLKCIAAPAPISTQKQQQKQGNSCCATDSSDLYVVDDEAEWTRIVNRHLDMNIYVNRIKRHFYLISLISHSPTSRYLQICNLISRHALVFCNFVISNSTIHWTSHLTASGFVSSSTSSLYIYL